MGSGADEVLRPAGQSLRWPVPRETSVAWSGPLGCGAWLSQQWSGECLSYTLKVVHPTFLGLLISVLAPLIPSGESLQEPLYRWYMAVLLGTPDAKWGISPGAHLWGVPLCRHGRSDHGGRHLTCVSLPGVICSLVILPPRGKTRGWDRAVLGWPTCAMRERPRRREVVGRPRDKVAESLGRN